jgi:hypothetical protein
MWTDNLVGSWSTHLWGNYIACGSCGGIRRVESQCEACSAEPYDLEPSTSIDANGTPHLVYPAFPGPEWRPEDYLFPEMMEREWSRELSEGDFTSDSYSPRASIVVLYWSYFETRIERTL